jgi:hypothetical protein
MNVESDPNKAVNDVLNLILIRRFVHYNNHQILLPRVSGVAVSLESLKFDTGVRWRMLLSRSFFDTPTFVYDALEQPANTFLVERTLIAAAHTTYDFALALGIV